MNIAIGILTKKLNDKKVIAREPGCELQLELWIKTDCDKEGFDFVKFNDKTSRYMKQCSNQLTKH